MPPRRTSDPHRGHIRLVSALNVPDPEHHSARKALGQASATVVSPLVMLEIEHITTRNVNCRAAHTVNDWLLPQERALRVIVPHLTADSLRKARFVQDRYAALTLDLANAVNVVLVESYETDCVLTLSRRDFPALRPLTGQPAFRLLPDDL
jgi:uncharacterized protein